jgi:hypothetical protein
MIILEPGWKQVARDIHVWLTRRFAMAPPAVMVEHSR